MIHSDVIPLGWRDVFTSNNPRIGIGLDPATTTKKKSNPSSIAVVQQVGLSFFVRVLLRFKTSDPRVTTSILRELLDLPHGLKCRRTSILATNERFFAAGLKHEFAGICPVELVIESEGTVYLGQSMSMKAYLGNQLVNTIDDGYLALPDYPWVQKDLRQVIKEGGTFASDVDESGNHADAFCAISAALHSLLSGSGPVQASATQVGTFGSNQQVGRDLKNPYAHLYEKGTRLHA